MYKVICLGADGRFREEFFEKENDANDVKKFLTDFYGLQAKVVEVNNDLKE